MNWGGLENENLRLATEPFWLKGFGGSPLSLNLCGIRIIASKLDPVPLNGCPKGLMAHTGISGKIFLLSSLSFPILFIV